MIFEFFFKQLCDKFEKDNILYLVLRNYENLPYSFTNDVDLLVNKNDIREIESIITKTLNGKGYLKKTSNKFNFNSYEIKDQNNNTIVKLDLFSGLSKGWISYMDISYMFKNRRKKDCFYIPSLESELFSLILKEMYMYGKVREKYKKYLSLHLNEIELTEFTRLLHCYLTKKSAKFIINNLHTLCLVKHFPKPRIKYLLNMMDAFSWVYMAILNKVRF